MSRSLLATTFLAGLFALAEMCFAQTFNLPLVRDPTARPANTGLEQDPAVGPIVATAALYGMGGASGNDNKASVTNETYTTLSGTKTFHIGNSLASVTTIGTASSLAAIGVSIYNPQVDTAVNAQGQVAQDTLYPAVTYDNAALVDITLRVEQNPDYGDVSVAQLSGSLYFIGITSNAASINTGNPKLADVTIHVAGNSGSTCVASIIGGSTWRIAGSTTQRTLSNPTAADVAYIINSSNGMNSLLPCWDVVTPGTDTVNLRSYARHAGGLSGGSSSFSTEVSSSGAFEVTNQ